MQRHTFISEDPFDFEAGGRLDRLHICYHTSPRRFPGQKVIWICHALTANSDAEDWWPQMVGPGKPLDTDKYFVVCCNMIGSPYGSSGPASVDPRSGTPYYFNFPMTTVRDIVRSQKMILDYLEIDRIDLLIGSSIGGFQAIEWAVMYPDKVRHAVFMATLSRVTPWLTAFEESQRMALESDPSFRERLSLEGGKKGLACARSIAMISYRAEKGYNMSQKEASEDTIFADRSASYQRYQGAKLAARFDAYSYWYLSYEVDSNNVGRGRGGEAAALAGITADTTVVSIDTDLIFPPYEMEAMASRIPGARYLMISSNFGHDGFLLEYDQITEIVDEILKKL